MAGCSCSQAAAEEGFLPFSLSVDDPLGSQDRQTRPTDNLSYIKSLYLDTLWLGEVHAPLQDFVRVVSRLIDQRKATDDFGFLAEMLEDLMSANANAIATKMRETMPATLRRIAHDDADSFRIAVGQLGLEEWDVIAASLRSGAGSSVRECVREDKAGMMIIEGPVRVVGIVKQWLGSMESRELQLQVLVTLFALRICASHPLHLSQAQEERQKQRIPVGDDSQLSESQSQSQAEDQSQSQAQQPEADDKAASKRKRKTRAAHRFGNGLSQADAFPWQRRKPVRASGTPVAVEEGPVALQAEALGTRFEALSDKLCLLAVMNDLTEPLQPEEKDANKVLFGSAGRYKEFRDERDEAQWFCSSIIEPSFSRALPRQCSTLRSKCFVASGNAGPSFASTPARKLARTQSDVATLAEKRDVDLQRRDLKRKHSVKLKLDKQAPYTEVLQKELDAKKARRDSGPAAGKLRPSREVNTDRRFKRSSSAVLSDSVDVRPDGERASSVFGSRPFERTQSLAPSRRLDSAFAPRQASVPPSRLRAGSEAPPPVKEAQAGKDEAPSKEAFSDNDSPEEEEEEAIIIPRKARKTNGSFSTLGKWMTIDSQDVSLSADADISTESQPPSLSLLKRTISTTAPSVRSLERVKSGRNPFSASAKSLSQSLSEDSPPDLSTESCPADLGRIWRGSAAPLDPL